MATSLEALELKISANAQDAARGLDALIQSLSALSDALIKPYSDLRDFNEQLKELKKMSKIKISIEGNQTFRSVEKTTSAINKQTEAVKQLGQAGTTIGITNGLGFQKGFETDAERMAKNPQWYRDPIEQMKEAQEYLKENGGVASWAKENEEATKAVEELTSAIEKQTGAVKNNAGSVRKATASITVMKSSAKQAATEVKKAAETTVPLGDKIKSGISDAFSGITKLFNRITRIATTMMIRRALKNLVKAIKEGVNNLYEWAKAVNHAFADNLEKANGKLLTLKNSLGAALSPVITALIPLFNSLASAIINAANWINQFFALLSGQSTWIKAVEQGATDLDDAASHAGGAAKELLAAFDELNVISSQGGGGGSGKVKPDYEGMFEEIGVFDAKIREIVDFIKNNLEDIKVIALEIGAAIIAWKLADAFAESIPLLSTLFGFIAEGAVIAVTLQLNWKFMNEYLDTGKEGWLWAGALTTAVGSTAAWAIATKLFGGNAGYYAAAITLAATAATDIIADIKHTDVSAFDERSIKTRIKAALEGGAATGLFLLAGGAGLGTIALSAAGAALAIFAVATALKLAMTEDTTSIQWGSLHLTQEQINKWVKESGDFFTVNPETVINLTADNIKQINSDNDAITAKLTEVLGILEVVRLGLADDQDYAELKKQITGEGGLISKVNAWINSAESLDKLTLKVMPKLFGKTEAEQKEWYQSDVSGWNAVKTFVNDLGKQLADEIVEGEKGEIIVKRPERVATLLEEINRISEIIAGRDVAVEAEIDMDLKLKNVDHGNFEQALQVYESFKEQMQTAAEELAQQMLANKIRLVRALEEMVALDPDNEDLKKQLADAEAGLKQLKDNWEEIVNTQVEEWSAPGKNLFQEWFDGQTIEVDVNKEQWNVLINEAFGDIDKAILEALSGVDPALVDISKILNISGWSMLETKSKQSLIQALGGITSPDTINTLKNQLNLSADDLFEVSGWREMSTNEQLNFVKAMTDAFGSEEAIAAAKKAGMDVSALISYGMQSSDSGIRDAAKEWNKIISDEVTDITLDADIKANMNFDKTKVEKSTTEMANIVTNAKPKMTAKLTYNATEEKKTKNKLASIVVDSKPKMTASMTYSQKKAEEVANDMRQVIIGVKPKMDVGASVSGATRASIKSSIESMKPKVLVDGGISSGFTSSVANGVSNAVKNALNGRRFSINDRGNGNGVIAIYGTGGVVRNGEMFIARENGVPEMVGSIGNTAAVANNDQIVAGIEGGVARANAEQNALLRRQNEILLGILAKDFNVNIGASSGFGQTVKRSLEMYNAVGG